MSTINNQPEDPFPKWKWMMDWCKHKGIHPTDGWDLAEIAWHKESQ